ncbi:uncharacterized protein LOC135090351 [Scylla paramamosain]|uniref:uncharacterized protein LOC135090351 n=1 Tax=Scylla paramamosain TaxID=85552 RepID=UPI0030834A91
MERRSVLLLVAVVVVAGLAGSVGAACPGGYHILPYGACVKLLPLTGPSLTTWEEGNEKCKKEGGRLISLDTPEKLEQFAATLFELGDSFYGFPYWVGAKKTESGWQWLNGKKLFSRSHMWLPNEPAEGFTHAQVISMTNNPRYYLGATDHGRGSACETDEV